MIKINIQTKKISAITYKYRKYEPLSTPRTEYLKNLAQEGKLIAKIIGNQMENSSGTYHLFRIGLIVRVRYIAGSTIQCLHESENFDQVVDRRHLQFFKLKE